MFYLLKIKKVIMKKILFCLFGFLVFMSCTEPDLIVENYDEPLKSLSASNSFNYNSLEAELQDFWSAALDDYNLETFCSCECDGVEAAQDVLNTHHNLLPSVLSGYQPLDLECDELKDVFSQDCLFDNADDYFVYLDELIVPDENITIEEKLLIMSLLEEVKDNGTIEDISFYRESWYSLTTQSKLDNRISAFVIEVGAAADLFLPAMIAQNGGVEPPQAILNKIGGTLAGGFTGYLVDSFHDSFWGDNSVSESEAAEAFIKGAIGGAIRSL